MDAHQPEIKQFRNYALIELRFLVHFSNERFDPAFCEGAARFAEQLLVFRQDSQCIVGHKIPRLGSRNPQTRISPRKSRIITARSTDYNSCDMSHPGHTHEHHHDIGRSARGSLKAALIITSTFLVAEFLGALYTNSLALLADSGHMLTDVAALGLSFFAIRFATRRATPRKTYGFYRVEILVALLNGVFLVLISLYIFYEAYHRFFNPPEIRADWMLIVAAVGLLANLVSAYLLFGKHHESLNVRGAFFHVLTDAIGSVGAILASLAIIFAGFRIADPAISIV